MEVVSRNVVQGCPNADNPFHECTDICYERLHSGDVHKKEKKLFGFGRSTPSRGTPPASPARGSRSPLAILFGRKKVESESSSSSSSPYTTDHSNSNFLSRLSPLQEHKNDPPNNVDLRPSLVVHSGEDYFAKRFDEYDDTTPKPFGTWPKTPEHPLRTPQHRPRTPEPDPRPWVHQDDPISLETRPRTPIHESVGIGRRPQTPEKRPMTPEHPSNTRPRTPIRESTAIGRRPQTPETRPKTPEHRYDTRPRTPVHESVVIGRRPQTPKSRPSTPENPFATRPRTPEARPRTPEHPYDTRPRTPIHESATPGRRPQTPETRQMTTQDRGRTHDFMARSPGPRSKTPEPQPTYFEPSSRIPKPRSKTPEPSPRIPQTQPISQKSLDSAALQNPKTLAHRGKSQTYNYLGSNSESMYTEDDTESVLLFPELLLSPQERPHSRHITPNRRGYETATKKGKHFDQLDESESSDDDIFSFVDDQEDRSDWLYPEITPKSGSNTPVHHRSPRRQEELDKYNSEPPELPDESQSFSHSEISRMKRIMVRKNETMDEIQSILTESMVSVGDYKVKASVATTLQQILDKHGDIASVSKLNSLATKSHYLNMLATVVFELQTTTLKQLKETRVVEMIAIIKDVESVKIKAGWLKSVLGEILEAVKHYDQHKMCIKEKEVCEGDVLLARQEIEKQRKELLEKEKEMKEWKERVTKMAGKLGNLNMRRASLDKSLEFLSSKVDKFLGKPVCEGSL